MESIEQIKQQLLDRIDTSDLLEVKKVERYCNLLELDEECNAAIKKAGASIIIKNGSQEFIKSHPSMNDKIKINAQLIALEKSIKFKLMNVKEEPPSAAISVESKNERGGLI